MSDLVNEPVWGGQNPLDGFRMEADPAAGDPAGAGAADPGEGAATEPAWAPSQDEWQQVQSTLGAVADFVSRQAQVFSPQPQQGASPLAEYGPEFEAALAAYVDSRMAPVQQFTQEAQLAEAEERAQDILGDLVSKHGEFDRELAYARANTVLPAMVQRYGSGPKAAEAALEEGARLQREYEQRVKEQAVSQYTNQIKTLSGAASEPGTQYQVGVQQRTIPNYREGGSVTDRVFGRRSE